MEVEHVPGSYRSSGATSMADCTIARLLFYMASLCIKDHPCSHTVEQWPYLLRLTIFDQLPVRHSATPSLGDPVNGILTNQSRELLPLYSFYILSVIILCYSLWINIYFCYRLTLVPVVA